VLLTNLPKRELPVPAVSVDRLPSVPLIVPSTGGVIVDFLRRWYGSDFRNRLTIVATADDIYLRTCADAFEDGVQVHADLCRHCPSRS
jgi:hypothetical protein